MRLPTLYASIVLGNLFPGGTIGLPFIFWMIQREHDKPNAMLKIQLLNILNFQLTLMVFNSVYILTFCLIQFDYIRNEQSINYIYLAVPVLIKFFYSFCYPIFMAIQTKVTGWVRIYYPKIIQWIS